MTIANFSMCQNSQLILISLLIFVRFRNQSINETIIRLHNSACNFTSQWWNTNAWIYTSISIINCNIGHKLGNSKLFVCLLVHIERWKSCKSKKVAKLYSSHWNFKKKSSEVSLSAIVLHSLTAFFLFNLHFLIST